MISLIKSLRAKDLNKLTEKLEAWQAREMKRLGEDEKNKAKIEAIADKAECVSIFIEQAQIEKLGVAGLISMIEKFFNDPPKDGEAGKQDKIILCTCHKSKGLEWKKVFILDKNRFMPKWANKPWMIEQERNLWYVAITRAMVDLVYISSDSIGTRA